MKICIITAVWKRPEVFKIFAESIKSLEGDIVVCVAGSEGEKSRKMVEGYGFNYVEADNSPLNKKLNQASILSSDTDADYYLIMGSDDIINQPLLDKYITLAKKGIDHVYLIDCYFYDTATSSTYYWAGYKGKRGVQRALGAGRLLSRRLMEKNNWRCWNARRSLDRGMDAALNSRMRLKDLYSMGVRLKGTDMAIMDIKSEVNITPMRVIESSKTHDIFHLFDENVVKWIE